MVSYPFPPKEIARILSDGIAIPAHPLALNSKRKLDEKLQCALTKYYCDAGAGGIAMGVHTTQFAIHDSKVGLYEPVLSLASETIDARISRIGRPVVKIAGIIGKTDQAVREAGIGVDLGFHLGLISLGALGSKSNFELIEHLREIAQIMPIMGFYLQPDVGGRVLDYHFWRQAAEIENLIAIKIAPFNRYYTLDVIRAVADAGRADSLALYTGNDDNIVIDLLTKYHFGPEKGKPVLRIVGGLLGHWAVWTKKAVALHRELREIAKRDKPIPPKLLTLAQQITDANTAIFDPRNNFAGCIAGIHEILRRQGLLEGRWTLNPDEDLSPGQLHEIDRVYSAYPHLNDDNFVKENLTAWLC